MKIPFFAVDTPADVLLLNALLEGREIHCAEWDNVPHAIKEIDGKVFQVPMCPDGCVKDADDVMRKCGITLWQPLLTELEKQQWRDRGGHP